MAQQASYRLEQDGSFVIEDYQHQKTFSNFFPGVAGLWGIPMWVFFVNRGQGIASFGIESKDKPILEFHPANRAYRLATIQGFRTFIKIKDGSKTKLWEPFTNSSSNPYKVSQRMIVTSHDMTVEEENTTLGLSIRVNYFTLPQEPFAALVRRVEIVNHGNKSFDLEIIDGLPTLNPYGLKDWLGKHMSRTVEAWVNVSHVTQKAPFYQLKVEVADTPQVTHIDEGNFYFAFESSQKDGKLLDIVIDPAHVFGCANDFLTPEKFLAESKFTMPAQQYSSNRSPSALAFASWTLKAGQKRSLTALAGFAHDLKELKQVVVRTRKNGFIAKKATENKSIIDAIKDNCFTHSRLNTLDQYSRQNFLDNVLRGGLPISLQTSQGPVAFNVYSRKHGDLERDYNFFTLSPTSLSQGNGNYRDVNQNRRNDVWFNRDVGNNAVINFLSLIQADGYNPLVVKGLMFVLPDVKSAQEIVKRYLKAEVAQQAVSMMTKGFMPGDLIKFAHRSGGLKVSAAEFLGAVLAHAQKQELADPGEGFWTDHWTYNFDLIESYLGLFPEHKRELLFDKKIFGFYLSDFYVLPRDRRYVETPNGVRQYHSVEEHDKTINAKAKGHQLRVKGGQGEAYKTNLLVKLICLLANKAATLDPSGIGIEMEANKPNWYDALNGLPGLLGSSISETFEVKRLAQFILSSLDEFNVSDEQPVVLFNELADFIEGLSHLLSLSHTPLEYWQRSNDLKEHYRYQIRLGIDGKERSLPMKMIQHILTSIITRVDEGIALAQSNGVLFATYFYHEVTKYEAVEHGAHHPKHVRPTGFKRHELPLFLEGFVHGMRVQASAASARRLHQAITKSALYDKKLGMYKVNADLSKQTEEIGRTRIFPSGWLENESVWLHMEYKYLLELLRVGLYEEFFTATKTALVPFMDPNRYGRSILENSSFIASSSHEDASLHGQGFVARLSGSTAEFIHIWMILCTGLKPFALNSAGELTLSFKPILPASYFTDKADAGFNKHSFAFKFLGHTMVVYHNPKQEDTFGAQAVVVKRMTLHYGGSKKPLDIEAGLLSGAMAQDVRNKKFQRIDVYLG